MSGVWAWVFGGGGEVRGHVRQYEGECVRAKEGWRVSEYVRVWREGGACKFVDVNTLTIHNTLLYRKVCINLIISIEVHTQSYAQLMFMLNFIKFMHTGFTG